MQSLQNKTALITGAGKGIGRAVALALANEGVHPGLVARTEKDLHAVAAEVTALGVKAAIAMADVSDIISVNAAVTKIRQELGAIDILINNAGTATFGKFLELTPEQWENQIKQEISSTYLLLQV